MTLHPWRAATVVLLVSLAAACGDDADTAGDDEDSVGTTATTAEGSEGDDYGAPGGGSTSGEGSTIVAADFELSSVTVAAGSEVEFRNEDGTAHTATADDGSFDAGPVAAGESTTFIAPSEPGDHPFHCEIHPSMIGTVTVEG